MNMAVNKRKIAIMALLFAAFIGALFFVSCGGDYEKPSTTQTGSPLIPASTLKLWIDTGKVNSSGYDRVVVLDLTSYGTYTAGHVPGALFVDSNDLSQTRAEGVAGSGNEILEGSKMDDLVQRYGIDANVILSLRDITSITISLRASLRIQRKCARCRHGTVRGRAAGRSFQLPRSLNGKCSARRSALCIHRASTHPSLPP